MLNPAQWQGYCRSSHICPFLGYFAPPCSVVVDTLNFPCHTWSPLVFAAYTTSWVNEFYKLTTSCTKQLFFLSFVLNHLFQASSGASVDPVIQELMSTFMFIFDSLSSCIHLLCTCYVPGVVFTLRIQRRNLP